MSKRSRQRRKLRRLRKNLLRTPLPAHIDLVQWLKDRGYASTTGEAERILLDGRVHSESHVVGRRDANVQVGDMLGVTHVVDRYVPATARATLYVSKS